MPIFFEYGAEKCRTWKSGKCVCIRREKVLYFNCLMNDHASANYHLNSLSSYIYRQIKVNKVSFKVPFEEKSREFGKDCTDSFDYFEWRHFSANRLTEVWTCENFDSTEVPWFFIALLYFTTSFVILSVITQGNIAKKAPYFFDCKAEPYYATPFFSWKNASRKIILIYFYRNAIPVHKRKYVFQLEGIVISNVQIEHNMLKAHWVRPPHLTITV